MGRTLGVLGIALLHLPYYTTGVPARLLLVLGLNL